MNKLTLAKLGESIKQVFVDLKNYEFDKYVPEFKINDKYFADCFNITIVEPKDDQAPIFYHTFSPYDIISKQAPDQALVFQNGKLVLNVEFTPYIKMRTGVMSPVVLQAIGTQQLKGKILFIGSGRVASQSLHAFKEYFPELKDASFYNSTGSSDDFVKLAEALGVKAEFADLSKLSEYDYIICHSSAQEPVLTPEHKMQIKQGAFVSTFVSENFCEVADEFYDTAEANVITDWEQTISEAVELNRAVEKNIADKNKILFLHDIFTGNKAIDLSKKYTIYRSHGTPMQNLAVLKNLIAD